MKMALGTITLLVIAATAASAADLRIAVRHRAAYWRIGPQFCFLTPDVNVAINALGPYCSSPRAHYRRITWHY
jgi:hypothetical protein